MSIAACPYCGDQLADASPRYCADCGTPHHQDCWQENGGCTVFGCTSAPSDEMRVSITPPELVRQPPLLPNTTAQPPSLPPPSPLQQSDQLNYYVSRGGQQFGPYSLAALQQHFSAGTMVTSDLARSEAMQNWLPVSQVVGNVALGNTTAQPQSYGQVPTYTAPIGAATTTVMHTPLPPNLNWVIVLILNAITRGLFDAIWLFFQARYTKKLDPESNGVLLCAIAASCFILGVVLAAAGSDAATPGGLLVLAGFILGVIARYSLRSSIQHHFTAIEPITLQLSGVMTFFFGAVYFQYHFNRIHRWKTTGVLA
jgi:GYF domain 2/Prokaryotic RING finger family 1